MIPLPERSFISIALFLFRYTMDRPRFTDHLEAIKFICKDFWSELFKKQIDNLKTNHRVISVSSSKLKGRIGSPCC